MRLFKLLLMGGLSLVSLASHAETVKGLYQVREPVSSQAPEERDQATQRALDTLVLRLTGDPKAAQSWVGCVAQGSATDHQSIRF